MAIGPPDPWYRRYYGYSNRPYAGCGCLWVIIVILIIWWIIAFSTNRGYYWGW